MKINDTVMPPWMRNLINIMKEESREQYPEIQLPVPQPMSKEQVAEECDIIEEEGRKHELIEIDIS